MLTYLFTLAALACHPVAGDRVTGADLAAAEPAFRGVPGSAAIAFAPPVGGRKVLSTEELTRIARSHSLPLPAVPAVCFESPAAPLDPSRVEAAIRRALEPSDVAFAVITTSTQAVPPGEIVFPRSGLGTAPSASEAPITWRGYVLYQGGRRFDIWARVKLGDPEVRKGDVVHVLARNGAARLSLDAQAQSSGRLGDRIAVKNPSSGKVFTATVSGRGRALVDLSGNSE